MGNKIENFIKDHKNIRFERIVDYENMFEAYLKYSENIEEKKVKTGFPTIDNALGGIRPTQLVTFIAGPNVGKTAISLNIARNQIGQFNEETEQILYFSLETTEEELFERQLQMELDVWVSSIEKAFSTKDEEFIEKSHKAISRYRGITNIVYRIPVAEIPIYSQYLETETGRKTKLIIADYLGLVRNDNFYNEYAKITDTMQLFKEYALGLKIPIILMAGIGKNEGREKKELDLWSGKSSGEIAGSSNIIITIEKPKEFPMLSREQILEMDMQKIDILKLKIQKKKQGNFAETFIIHDKRSQRMYEFQESKMPIGNSGKQLRIDENDDPF